MSAADTVTRKHRNTDEHEEGDANEAERRDRGARKVRSASILQTAMRRRSTRTEADLVVYFMLALNVVVRVRLVVLALLPHLLVFVRVDFGDERVPEGAG